MQNNAFRQPMIKQLLVVVMFLVSLLTVNAAVSRHSFEGAADGAVIESSIPSLLFTVDSGGNWLYADIRTGSYDAPYPRGAFAVDGNGFAWTAQAPGNARITFTEGTATFFAAAFSTKDTLTVTGYNSDDREVDSVVVRPNANTGRLTVARLEAPAGQGLASVVIRGTQNRWIMDNLETDAPLAAEQESAKSAFVTVAQLPSPNIVAASGSVVSYEIVSTNRGRGTAKNVQITMPFDPTEVTVLDASFSRSTAWVSRLLTSTLQIDTGTLSRGDMITATVRLRILPGVVAGTALGERLTYRWADGAGDGSGQSNLPVLTVGQQASSSATYPLVIEHATAQTLLNLASPIFVPNEPVALWYDTPDGRSVAAGTATADGSGTLRATISTADLPPGQYHLVAHGQWSQLTAARVTEVR